MTASIINVTSVANADAVVLGVPYERSASFGSGAAAGPEAIIACLDRQVELFERRTRTEPARMFKIAKRMLADVGALNPDEMVDKVASEVSRIDAFCALLGGVHSVSVGAMKALANKYTPSQVTVVQIDAHLDLRPDDSDYNDVDPSPFAHSCVMRRAVDLGYRTCSVGIRAYTSEEYQFAADNRLPVFEWGAGKDPEIGDILSTIETEHVYITIDVDGLDPSVAPATGTPVPGGLSYAYCSALLETLALSKTIVGFDIVEVSPSSCSSLTEYTAAQLCYNMIGYSLLKARGMLRFMS